MQITGIGSLVYGSSDIEESARFFTDLGFEAQPGEDDGRVFTLADGCEIILRDASDPSLPPAPVEGDTVREIIWQVADKDTLSAVADAISIDRDVTESGGALHCVDDLGYALGFKVSSRKEVAREIPVINTVGNRPRRNTRGDGTEITTPKLLRLAHIGCWAPGDVDENKSFYVDRLGFRETDYIKNIGVFLRAPGSNEHHDIFLSRRGERAGFQHAAFEVRDLDEVMFLGSQLEEKGWVTHFGPGRHIFGSNIFWYFWNPAGGLIEITADLDYVDDEWEAGYHEQLPKGAGTWLARPIDMQRMPFRTREEDQIIE